MFLEFTVDNVVFDLINRGEALTPDIEARAADLMLRTRGRMISANCGLSYRQIADIDHIIERMARESTMTYAIAEDRLRHRLSDWDDDIRALFVSTFLDGDAPHHLIGRWCDEAHKVMTERKSERARMIFGLTPEQAREARASQ